MKLKLRYLWSVLLGGIMTTLAGTLVAAQTSTPIVVSLACSTNTTGPSIHSFQGHPATATNTLPPGGSLKSAIVFSDPSSSVKSFIFTPRQDAKEVAGQLWGDFDGDGQFGTNETITIAGDKTEDTRDVPYSILVTDGGHRHRVSGSLCIYHYGSNYWYCRFTSHFAFTGILYLTGQPCEILIRDDDGCGIIANAVSDQGHALIGFRPVGSTNQWTMMPLRKTIGWEGNLYDVGLAFEGSSDSPSLTLTLTPIPSAIGYLNLTGSNIQSVVLQDSQRVVRFDKPGAIVSAPTGTWSIYEIIVREGDIEFTSSSRYHPITITIGVGQTVKLEEGGPIQQNIKLAGNVYGSSVSLNMGRATGRGNREYQSGGSNPSLKWTLQRQGGKSLDCGVFEYG